MKQNITVGIVPRVFAFLFDIIIIVLPLSIIFNILVKGNNEFNLSILSVGIKFSSIVIIIMLYFLISSLMIYYLNGETIGKKILHIRIVGNNYKSTISIKQILIRQFIFLLYFISLFHIVLFPVIIITLLFIYFRKDNKSIHDIAASTFVIYFNKNEISRW